MCLLRIYSVSILKPVNNFISHFGYYVYEVVNGGGVIDMEKVLEFCAKIDDHIAIIEGLEADAKQSGEDISGAFGKDDK